MRHCVFSAVHLPSNYSLNCHLPCCGGQQVCGTLDTAYLYSTYIRVYLDSVIVDTADVYVCAN